MLVRLEVLVVEDQEAHYGHSIIEQVAQVVANLVPESVLNWIILRQVIYDT